MHIVGGELIYDHLGSNKYRITLKLYRDCLSGGAQFDGIAGAPALLTVRDVNDSLIGVYNMGTPIVTKIPPSINNPCIKPPNNVCVEEGLYIDTLTLPPKTGGYYLVYQRCCRNNTILNLALPGDQGSTYYTKIPGPEEVTVNSSPRFKNFPPIYLCSMVPFTFDHSATDPDGDLLEYSFFTPFQGLSQACPALGSAGCPTVAPPLPYQDVNYASGYSGNYPIAGNPSFSVHPATGELSGTPTLTGQFVVGVCVKEYRNGKLLNTHYRDFQFNVIQCQVQIVSSLAGQTRKCMGNVLTFTNQSSSNLGGLTYSWDFGVPGITTDTSTLKNPYYDYADTGKYVVTLIASSGECTDTFQKTVYVYPNLDIDFNVPSPLCLKNNSLDFITSGSHHETATFTWEFGAALPAVSNSKNENGVVYNEEGTFYPKLVVRQFNCVDSCIDTVRIIGRPEAKINNLPNSYCAPAHIGFSNGSKSEIPPLYIWYFSNGQSTSDFEPVQVFSPPGVYGATLIAITGSVCPDTSITSVNNITVNPKPEAGFDVSPKVISIFEPEVGFTNLASDDVVNWFYSFGDGNSSSASNLSYSYKKPGDYFVQQIVYNSFDCSDTAHDKVRILPEFRFWVPNTFTPNNDGTNDIFMPKVIGAMEYEFKVYNKWGELIFETNNYESGWDGSFKGEYCEQDVYVWKVILTDEVDFKQREYFGHVLLLSGDK